MATSAIYQQLLPIFHDVFDREDIELTPELAAADLDEWDSLTNIRLFVAIEQAFGIRFGSDEINSLRNVGELAEMIETKLA
ncbi:MAG: acyl carrier protein [Rhodospirillales bacterium]|jgi:acyl carrier protein|nr:acyl carrier protein [Rhodospirillales bacterium]